NHKMARQAQGGYMEWPSAPRWMEPLLADDGQGQLVTVSRLANADLQQARDSNGGLRLEDLRYPTLPPQRSRRRPQRRSARRALDVSSVTGRHYSRRRMIVQPDGFFGHQGQPVSQSSHQSLRRATFA
uniref:Cytochrome cd1 nitrite reductase n=1 Tax=Macrostomum lignano TaxID=282301 RepID=A0A1I8I7L7_9PLAT